MGKANIKKAQLPLTPKSWRRRTSKAESQRSKKEESVNSIVMSTVDPKVPAIPSGKSASTPSNAKLNAVSRASRPTTSFQNPSRLTRTWGFNRRTAISPTEREKKDLIPKSAVDITNP